MITKDHAVRIAAKLHATIRQGGSRRDAGHDHIPASIYVGTRSALDLARCPMSYEQWIEVLRGKRLI